MADEAIELPCYTYGKQKAVALEHDGRAFALADPSNERWHLGLDN